MLRTHSRGSSKLVTIVLPVYNVRRYLKPCLTSIERQTYSNIRLIIVDDASVDGSLEELERFPFQRQAEVVRHDSNLGLSAARNTGWGLAAGEYLMFMDSDDVIDPTYVATCVREIEAHGADLAVTTPVPFVGQVPPGELESGVPSPMKIEEYLAGPYFAWAKMFRVAAFPRDKYLFIDGLKYEDWPFHWSLAVDNPGIVRIPSALYFYRQREGAITGKTGVELLDQYKAVAVVLTKSLPQLPGARAQFMRMLQAADRNVFMRIQISHLQGAVAESKALWAGLMRSNRIGDRARGNRCSLRSYLHGYAIRLMPNAAIRWVVKRVRSLKQVATSLRDVEVGTHE